MKILFLSRWFPFPPDNGSKIRVFHLLNGLSQFHDVTLLSFYDTQSLPVIDPDQRQICSDIHIVPWTPFDSKSVKAQIGFLSFTPRSLIDTYSHQMASLIRRAMSEQKYDIVIASQLSMASYFKVFRGTPAIFEEIELGIFHDQAFHDDGTIKQPREWLTWLKLQLYFSRLLDSFTGCTIVSEKERNIFNSSFKSHTNKINILPNCVNLIDYKNTNVTKKKLTIIFSGSFSYSPNYQAMQWFVENVYPFILKSLPDANLIITGNHENLTLSRTENITFAGYVDDIKSLIASCDISIAPLWTGGGTRLKILEAMAVGIPVVATSKGAEGLAVQNGEHILISDEPQEFAEYVIQLFGNKELRRHISANALRLVKEQYDWSIVMPGFLTLIEKAVEDKYSLETGRK